MQLCSLRFMTAVVEPGGAKPQNGRTITGREEHGGVLSVPNVKFNQVT